MAANRPLNNPLEARGRKRDRLKSGFRSGELKSQHHHDIHKANHGSPFDDGCPFSVLGPKYRWPPKLPASE